MPVPLNQHETGDLWNTNAGDYLPTSTWDSIAATANLAVDKTSLGIAGDIYLKSQFDDMALQKTLSVKELNEKYMGSGINWTSPQKEITAEMMVKHQEQMRMWANRSSQGNSLLNLGTGLLVGAGDPAMVGIGAAMSAALKGGAILRGGALFARNAEGGFVKAGFGATLARGGIEGAAAMVPIEAADVARNRMYERDVSMTESLTNIAHGAAFGATLHGTLFGARKAWENRGWVAEKFGGVFRRRTQVEDVMAAELASKQMAEGKRPTVQPVLEHLKRERDGAVDIGKLPYEFQPLDTSVPVTKEYYLGAQSASERLHDVAPIGGNSSTDFGGGLYGSDRISAENGFASSDIHGVPGLIHRFETQGAKLFDTEAPLDQATAAILAGEIKPFERDVAKAVADGEITLRQAYEHLPAEAKDQLNKKLSELGYDGLHYTEGEGAQRNGVMLFPDKAESVRVTGEPYQADATMKDGLTPAENQAAMEKYAARENELFHSKEEDAAIDAAKKELETYDPDDPEHVETEYARTVDLLKQLDEKGALSEQQKAIVDEVLGKSNGEGPSLSELKSQGEGLVKEMGACVVEH